MYMYKGFFRVVVWCTTHLATPLVHSLAKYLCHSYED